MNKIEKIISAYECGNKQFPGERCKTCPYGYGKWDDSGDNSFWWCDADRIEEDAINLLKIFMAIIE